MKPLVLDANMLLGRAGVCAQARSLGFAPVVLRSTVEEITHVAARKGETGADARVALRVINAEHVPVLPSAGKGDAAILGYASANRCAVATNDRQLIKALQAMRITVMRLRQGRLLTEA